MTVILLADGFEETEALAPYDILKRGKVDVRFVSISSSLQVKGAHGVVFTADELFENVRDTAAEMVVLPGGMPGTTHLDAFAPLDGYLARATYLGAICAAPSVLGKRGLLRGKRAVCFPGFESALEGAKIVADRVVRDGNIVTAKGAGAALEFGFALLSVLQGEDVSRAVRASMQ